MRSFLFSHRGALGDFTLTLPTLVSLRWKHPEWRFIGLGRPEYLALAREFGLVDDILDCESADFLPFYEGKNLPAAFEGVESALFWMDGPEALKGLLSGHCTGPVHFHSPFPGKGEHVMDYHLQCLPYFSLPAISEEDPMLPLSSVREPYALIHPGSGSAAKNYDPEFYAFLANEIRSRRFPDVRIVLGPQEAELKRLYENRYTVECPENPVALARLLSRASVFIGNDSGVSHLAALLGVHTLALFKGRNHEQWGVRGRKALSLEAANEALAMTRIQKALLN